MERPSTTSLQILTYRAGSTAPRMPSQWGTTRGRFATSTHPPVVGRELSHLAMADPLSDDHRRAKIRSLRSVRRVFSDMTSRMLADRCEPRATMGLWRCAKHRPSIVNTSGVVSDQPLASLAGVTFMYLNGSGCSVLTRRLATGRAAGACRSSRHRPRTTPPDRLRRRRTGARSRADRRYR
jgi:hypothetical protein